MAFLHVTMQVFMLFSFCSCTVFQSRPLHLKPGWIYEPSGKLVKMQILFQEVRDGTYDFAFLIKVPGDASAPGSWTRLWESSSYSAPCPQRHLAGGKEHEARGDSCGAGLELTYVISAHVLLTKAQEMAVPNSQQARKCRWAVCSGRRNIS